MPIFVLMIVPVIVIVPVMVIMAVVIMVVMLFLFLLLLFFLCFFLVRKQGFLKAGMFMNRVVFVAMGIGNRLVAQLISTK